MNFSFVRDFPKYFNYFTLSKDLLAILCCDIVLHSVHETCLRFLTIYFETSLFTSDPSRLSRLFVRHLDYNGVPTNTPEDTRFSALLSATYVRASTSLIRTLPIICYSVIFQEVGYFENSILSSSLRNKPSPLSGSCINSRHGR